MIGPQQEDPTMRYIVLAASVVIQASLGSVYAWTTFVDPLTGNYGLSTTETQVVFGCLIAVFAVTMIFAGRLLSRLGPRTLSIISGLLFGCGYIIASFGGGSFLSLLIGVAFIVGLGTGCGYVVPLAVCARWFPDHKGLVTGLAVAGFGGGAVALTSMATKLLDGGMDVLHVLRVVGLLYGSAVVLAALFVRSPAPLSTSAEKHPISVSTLARDHAFRAFVIGIFCGTFSGLLVIGVLSPMAGEGGLSSAMAALAVSVFAVGNAAGRISWGVIADRLAGPAIMHNLIFLALSLAAFLGVMNLGSAALFIIASGLVGFGFGGCFVVYAAAVGSRYGIDRLAGIYPLVFLAYGASGIVGPLVGGVLHDVFDAYTHGVTLSVLIVVAGMIGSGIFLRISRRNSPDYLRQKA